MNPPTQSQPSLQQLFWLFSRIAIISVGGGVTGWLLRELVIKHKWLSSEEFFSGLAIAQALPGLNVVNLAIWIGYRLHGGAGAFWCAIGMIIPPLLLALLLYQGYEYIQTSAETTLIMSGVAAAAIGLSFEMGFHATKNIWHSKVSIGLLIITFSSIYLLKINFLVTVLILSPISVIYFYKKGKKEKEN